MNNIINTYDILNRILKYKCNFKEMNPLAKFEYILSEMQLTDLLHDLEMMLITINEDTHKNGHKYWQFWFCGCQITINENLPL